MKFTEEQQKVIDTRGRNLLVSAAAGSGKTAVLIEHILSLVGSDEHGTDVDRLLVVTFTNAAAAEMRDRLYKALQEKADAHPENAWFRRQLQLVSGAKVCTIDSFCMDVIRNHFAMLDIDPAFRMGDEGEIELLKSDVMEELLEDEYAEARQEFIDFTETCAGGKQDDKVGETILKLYGYSQSSPDPDGWLSKCLFPYRTETPDEIRASWWYTEYVSDLQKEAGGAIASARQLLRFCDGYDTKGFVKFGDAIRADLEMLDGIQALPVGEFVSRLSAIDIPDNPRKTKEDEAEAFDKAKNGRKTYKAIIDKVKNDAGMPAEAILNELQLAWPFVEELVRLTKAFAARFAIAKKKKQILDFNDMEHFAIEILLKDGQPTEAARRLSEQFDEIMIDEYQDSNEVQEALLTAVSKHPDHPDNVFMVGDMKQSIYKFRMARPELFLMKYLSYPEDGYPQGKIELFQNFRSRREVIDSVNDVFYTLMHESVGRIEYDEKAALHQGAEFKETDLPVGGKTELLILELDPKAGADAGEETPATEDLGEDSSEEGGLEFTANELEARMIAQKILELTDPENGQFVEEDNHGHRRAKFSDIVVLLRTVAGVDRVFADVFRGYGIPVYLESKAGYYNSFEIGLVLDILSVIDDPLNDIPLAAVLRSPVFCFTAEELAALRIQQKERNEYGGLYHALKGYEGPLRERIDGFFRAVEHWRKEAAIRKLSDLIRMIYDESGLYLYAAAMPGGDQRTANLESLLIRAAEFENTSYHGVFNFIRYIEKRKNNAMDEGEASAEGEGGNVVRIMTIHKSKGLQFPIVFVANCGKQFNRQDEHASVLLDQDNGIGVDAVDYKERTKTRTFIKRAFSQKRHKDDQGENLRVLYVAMTRAKERLFLTGSRKKLPAESEAVSETDPNALFSRILNARSFLDWLLLACPKSPNIQMYSVIPEVVLLKSEETLAENGIEESAGEVRLAAAGKNTGRLSKEMNFPYIYDDLCRVHTTMSVSALKRQAMEAFEEAETREPVAAFVDDLPQEEKVYAPRPAFMKKQAEKAELSGAERGTLYHKVLEFVEEDRKAQETIAELVNEGLISEVEKDTINPNTIEKYRTSALAKRFFAAKRQGKAWREKQFIIGRPVKELLPEVYLRNPKDELLMVQGIIDLYFEEPDGLVLADYKTDRVDRAEELVDKYHYQLELYEKALVQITGKPVKEKWIYSLYLGMEIRL